MNDNHKSHFGESNNVLDRAILAATAQSGPADAKNRVIETAAAWQQQAPIAAGGRQRAANVVLMEEEREVQSRVRIDASNNHFFEKVKTMILAHKRLSATAVTLTALAASLLLYAALFSSSTPAYALEQTAQANNYVTTYHVKITPPAATHDVTNGLSEGWVQVDAEGTPLRARLDYPETNDGAKVVIFSAGKAEWWNKSNKSHGFVPAKDALDVMTKMQYVADPKLLFAELQAARARGEVQVATKEPAKAGEPVMLTVTSEHRPDFRRVLEVDPKTKLLARATTYRRLGNQWKQVELREFLDYNKEIDPRVFQLDLPNDVITLDQINKEVGLPKGNLTDDEIATKVVRTFFEALIAEDYEKAGLLLGGISAEKMKEVFGGHFKVFRIVETGKPTPAPNPEMHALQVPIKVEWDMKRTLIKQISPKVRTTDEQKASKVVRKFFEALIHKDDGATSEGWRVQWEINPPGQ
jgi:hypothetical protein